MIIITIKQFDIVEDMMGLSLTSNKSVIEKAKSEDKEKIEKILKEYEILKKK